MNAERFIAVIRAELERAEVGPGPADTARRKDIHVAVRAKLMHKATAAGLPADKLKPVLDQLDIAIARSEAELAEELRRQAFVPPNDTPRSATEYFWITVGVGCSAVMGVLDFLKPLIDLQRPAFILAALGVIASSVLLRLTPSFWLRKLRGASVATAAAVVALIGVQAQFPGNAPNGAIAEVVPKSVEWQEELFRTLREPIEQMSKDTTKIAEDTGEIRKQLEQIAENQDGRKEFQEAITRSGFSFDAMGLYQAITSDDPLAYTFAGAGLQPSIDDFESMLLNAEVLNGNFGKVVTFLALAEYSQAKRRLKEESEAWRRKIGEAGELDTLYARLCGATENDSQGNDWFERKLAETCADHGLFYVTAMEFLRFDGANFADFPGGAPLFRPVAAMKQIEVSSLFQGTRRFGELRGQFFASSRSLLLLDDKFNIIANFDYNPRDDIAARCGVGYQAKICSGRIFLFTDSFQRNQVVGSDLAISGLPSPVEAVKNSAEAQIWTFGVSVSDDTAYDRYLFAGVYNPGDRLAAMLYCIPSSSQEQDPTLVFRADTGSENAADLFMYPTAWPTRGYGKAVYTIDASTSFSGEVVSRPGNAWSVSLSTDAVQALAGGSRLNIELNGGPVGSVTLAGLTKALADIQQLTACSR